MAVKMTKAQLEAELVKAQKRIAALERNNGAMHVLAAAAEPHYQSLFEEAAVSLWEEDFSAVKTMLDELKKSGINELPEYLSAHPEFVFECISRIKVTDVNKAALRLFEVKDKTELIQNLKKGSAPENIKALADVLITFSSGETTYFWEGLNYTINGRKILAQVHVSILPGCEASWSRIIVSIIDNTERRQAEEAQRHTEIYFRSLFEQMHDAVFILDLEGNHMTVNQRASDMLGYRASEILGLSVADTSAQPQESLDVIRRLVNGEQIALYERIMRKKDGTPITVEINVELVRDVDGKPLHIQSVIRDITERKQAEQKLAASESRLRALIANTGDLIIVIDAEGRITFASQASERILGYKPEESLGQNFMDWVHPQDLPEVMTAFLSRRQTPGTAPASIQVQGRHKDGTWRHVEALGTNLLSDPAVQGIIINIHDITEQKRAELEKLVLYEIIQGTAYSKTLEEFLGLVHYSINRVLRADNLFVSLYHPSTGFFEDVYCVDEYDEAHQPSSREGSLTAYIFQTGIPLLVTDKKFDELVSSGKAKLVGVDSKSWMGVPLKTAGQTIGVLAIQDYQTENLYSEKDLAFLASISGQVASAVERKQAEDRLHDSEERYRLLFNAMLDGFALHEIICDEHGTPHDYRFLEVNTSFERMTGLKGVEIIGKTVLELMPDTETYWIETYGRVALTNESIRFENYSQALGKYYDVVAFSPKKNQFATIFNDITDRKKTEAEIKRQLSELETLYESGLAISRLLTPKEIAQKMIEILDRRMNWHHIAIRQYDSETRSVKLIAFHRPDTSAEEAEEYIVKMNQVISNPDQGLSGWVTLNAKSLRVPNVKTDSRYVDVFPGIRSGLYVPLMLGERVIGSVSVESEEENAFTGNNEQLLETLAGQAAIAIENANLFQVAKREVAERQQAEAALRLQSEKLLQLNDELEQRVRERTTEIEATRRRLELATDAAGLGIWEWDILTGNMIWDAQMHDIYDIPVREFDGKIDTLLKSIHPADQGLLLRVAQDLMENKGTNFKIEHRLIRKNRETHTLFEQGVAVFDQRGMLARIIGIVNDITQQKQAEQDLRESEAYARLLFDAAPDPVSVFEADGAIVDVNQLFEQQYNVKREEVRGRNVSELNLFPAEQLNKAKNHILEIAGGKNVPPFELDYYYPGGGLHTLEMASYPIEVQGRRLVLSTSRDITLHKKAEESLRLANVEMERALRVKDEFLANMSHELRTPLNAILGMSESLEEQIAGALNEKQLKYIRTIRESGRHLLELINDILDLSKIEAGRLELNISHIPVSRLCEASLRMVKEQAQKKGQTLVLDIDPDVKIIMGDERRLKQSLVNLLINAVKFTSKDRRVGLQVKGNPRNQTVVFTVWDEGIGITADDLKLIFKPFVQLDAGLAREFSGTGLGLALVAQMVRLHGGNVSVESKEGEGSRFIITLPWVDVEESFFAAKLPRKTGPLSVQTYDSAGEKKHHAKILIVEDTDSITMLLSEYLQYKGYEILAARNGMEGVMLAVKEKPDLILMDVMMPVMDGVEATKMIRAEKDLAKVPIIALTALAMPGDKERCLQAGMNEYLSKPVQMTDLYRLVTSLLQE